jgi:hypothetical protein
LAAACLAATAAAGAATQAGPALDDSLEAVPGLREEVVLRGATVAGRRLDLNRFIDPRSPAALQDAVRAAWAPRPAPVHALHRDGWLVLVQAVGAAVETIEIRVRGSGSEGRHARLSRPDPEAIAASGWLEDALPAGSRVLRSIMHRDGDRRMTTVVAVSTRPAAVISQGLLASLRRHGFHERPRGTPSFSGAGGSLQFLARGSEELAMAISEQAGERAIVLHWGRAGR